jgi:hypothetical protein
MTAEYIAMIRLVQLCLGSVIGFGCIYLGYKLFSQIPVRVTNDGYFKMPKLWDVKLKVAPGVFFAILGAAIVYFSIDRQVGVNSVSTHNGNATIPTIPGASSDVSNSFSFSNSPRRTGNAEEAVQRLREIMGELRDDNTSPAVNGFSYNNTDHTTRPAGSSDVR